MLSKHLDEAWSRLGAAEALRASWHTPVDVHDAAEMLSQLHKIIERLGPLQRCVHEANEQANLLGQPSAGVAVSNATLARLAELNARAKALQVYLPEIYLSTTCPHQ